MDKRSTQLPLDETPEKIGTILGAIVTLFVYAVLGYTVFHAMIGI